MNRAALFCRVYELSSSLAEVSVLLRRRGWVLDPKEVRRMARCLRNLGVRLKHMPRTELPSYNGD